MVESEVKIKVRLEIDESDKSTLRSQARAIQETGGAPIQGPQGDTFRGGIFGDTEDPDVKGFEARQSIGGGVERLRDRTSSQAIQRENIVRQNQDKINALEANLSTPDRAAKFLGLGNFEAKNLLDFATNPTGALAKLITTLGPIAALTGVIGVALSSPQIVQTLVDIITQRGGPFSRFFQREILNERNPFRSREQQKLIQIGEAQIISTQVRGFTSASASALTSNTLAQVRANGISDIGLRDKAGGLF